MFAMQHYKLGWEDGLHMVQNRRYCISPNGGFLTQIKVSCRAGWKYNDSHLSNYLRNMNRFTEHKIQCQHIQ